VGGKRDGVKEGRGTGERGNRVGKGREGEGNEEKGGWLWSAMEVRMKLDR
jgi:hypothetical protein